MTTPEKPDDKPPGPARVLIGVVGPCGSGKTTLTASLNRLGYRTRHIAQEHSYVKDMWQRLTRPGVLVFLDASYPVTCRRRRLDWTELEYAEQQHRLEHARQHANFYLITDNLTAEQVLEKVVEFLQARHEISPHPSR
jgi:deoxyadenosine/deoxycytidine kinase